MPSLRRRPRAGAAEAPPDDAPPSSPDDRNPPSAAEAATPWPLPIAKATPSQTEALTVLRASLLCPLCSGLMTDPATLQCSHSFCKACIEVEACESWLCPIPGCSIPISMRSSASGSFARINPQLHSAVQSLRNIVKAVNAAPDGWWKGASKRDSGASADVEEDRKEKHVPDEEEEEMVDFNMDSKDLDQEDDSDEEEIKDGGENGISLTGEDGPAEKDTSPRPTKRPRSSEWPSDERPETDSSLRASNVSSRAASDKRMETVDERESDEEDSGKEDGVGSLRTDDTNDEDGESTGGKMTQQYPEEPTEEELTEDGSKVSTLLRFDSVHSADSLQEVGGESAEKEKSGLSTVPEGDEKEKSGDSLQTSRSLGIPRSDCGESAAEVKAPPDARPNRKSNDSRSGLDQSCSQGPLPSLSASPIGMAMTQSPNITIGGGVGLTLSATTPTTGNKTGTAAKMKATMDVTATVEDIAGVRLTVSTPATDAANATATTEEVAALFQSSQASSAGGLLGASTSTHILLDGPTPTKTKGTEGGESPLGHRTSSGKKQRASPAKTETPPSVRRARHRPQAVMPRVFLLSPPSNMSAHDVRMLRRGCKAGMFSFLGHEGGGCHMARRGAEDLSDLEVEFDFETDDEQGIDPFVSLLQRETGLSEDDATWSGPETTDRLCQLYRRCYAVCSAPDEEKFAMSEGFIIPRSFRYLLAVAAGLTIADLSYIREAPLPTAEAAAASKASCFLAPPDMAQGGRSGMDELNRNTGGRRTKVKRGGETAGGDENGGESFKPNIVIADQKSGTWASPGASLRSREAILDRAKDMSGNLQINNGLLDEYIVLIYGEFDKVRLRTSGGALSGGRRRAARAESAKAKGHQDDSNTFSRGRIKALLRLCGAQVLEHLDASAFEWPAEEDIGEMNCVVLLRQGPNAKDCRTARKFLTNSEQQLWMKAPVVGCDWLLDSIGDFALRGFSEYVTSQGK